jgi:hypothetical protein
MARISFAALIESITGKLAGSVFQDSYGGWQIRTRVSPRNPQTNYQQLRRGEFGFISASWRSLSLIERQTFIDAASTPPAALNLFIQANVNLTLIEEPIITTYVPSTAPILMPLQINDLTPLTFIIQASSGTVLVPAGTKLLVYATTDRLATQIFTNPSAYTPLLNFDEGSDLSVPADIISNWNAHYGQLRSNRNVCIKAVLIDKSNGSRGPESIICQISSTPITMDTLQDVINNGAILTVDNTINTPANFLDIIAGDSSFTNEAAEIYQDPNELQFYVQNAGAANRTIISMGTNAINIYVDQGSNHTHFNIQYNSATIEFDGGTPKPIVLSINGNTADTSGNVKATTRLTQFLTPENSVGTSSTPVFVYAIPANTFANDGDTISFKYWGISAGGALQGIVAFVSDFTTNTFGTGSPNSYWQITVTATRTDSATIRFSIQIIRDNGTMEYVNGNASPDFTMPINVELDLTASAAQTIQAQCAILNLTTA